MCVKANLLELPDLSLTLLCLLPVVDIVLGCYSGHFITSRMEEKSIAAYKTNALICFFSYLWFVSSTQAATLSETAHVDQELKILQVKDPLKGQPEHLGSHCVLDASWSLTGT